MSAAGDARRARLGPENVARAHAIAHAAPPLTAEQHAALSILLRRPPVAPKAGRRTAA